MDVMQLGEVDMMLHEARAAFEASDIQTALAIEARLNQVGYSLVVRNGGLWLENQTAAKEAPRNVGVGVERTNYSR